MGYRHFLWQFFIHSGIHVSVEKCSHFGPVSHFHPPATRNAPTMAALLYDNHPICQN